MFKFTSVWGLENIILITAIVLLAEESDATRTLATALFLSAESFFYSFIFLTCYDIGRRTRRPAVFILGIFYSLALMAMGAGRLFSTRIDALPGGIVTMLVIMSTLVVVEMVMALRLGIFKGDIPLFVEVRGDGEGAGEGASRAMGEAAAQSFQLASVAPVPAVPEPAPDAQRLAHLAAEAGLTQTEEQIALLAVRGRSRAVIARELGYSANTVRNYTHTLYSKLGIHSKQELIDLVEGSGQAQKRRARQKLSGQREAVDCRPPAEHPPNYSLRKGPRPGFPERGPSLLPISLQFAGSVSHPPAYFAACSSSYFSMAACSSALGLASAAAWASAMETEPTGLLPSSAGAGSA